MFCLTNEAIDPSQLHQKLDNPKAGSIVVFEGLVRNHNEGLPVDSLEYEAFADLCFAEADRILVEAREKFGIYDVVCSHRVGHLAIEDIAVWIGVSSAHRDAGFQACRFVIDEIKTRLPIWKKEHYTGGKAEWVNCQQCAQASQTHIHHSHGESCEGHHHGPTFSEEEYYSRQIGLPQFGKEGQEQLKKSSVLVIGAGGLGSAALPYLTSAGVGKIAVCDGDLVEASNLHRQTLYGWKDVGLYKADRAVEKLKDINPFIEIIAHREHIDFENCERLISGYDLVVDCTDNFKTKFLVHDLCFLRKIPLVQSSIYQMEGQVQVFDPNVSSGCMRCEWPQVPEEGCVGTCATAGVLGVVPGVFGSFQALEAIKLLLGWPSALTHETHLLDLSSGQWMPLARKPKPTCPLCGGTPVISEIVPENYLPTEKSYEVQGVDFPELVERFNLVDIRGESERASDGSWIEKTTHLPGATPQQCMTIFEDDRPILVICRKGMRSRNLVEKIREQGNLNVFSLVGGAESLFTGKDSQL